MVSMMDQKNLWEKWSGTAAKMANSFARRSFSLMMKLGNYKTLLDLGCGFGQDASYFAKKGLQVTGGKEISKTE
jgi:cyclopropane fatty-acyl-phospholipid synthase-like methyltransferase